MAKHTYEIDINTSGLISGYKNALKQMEQAGVSTDITKGLATSLKKLEDQFKNLEDEGKRGFTNSKDIENYRKRFDKLLNSLRGFEGQMSRVGVDISDVMKKSAAATQKLNDAFKNLNVKNIDQAMNSVLNSTDKMKAASLALKKELDDRVNQVNSLKQAWDNAKTSAAQNVEATKAAGANSLKKVYTNANGNNAQIFNRSVSTSRKDDIIAQASEAIKATDNITDAWARMTKYITDNGLDKAFTANGMAGLRQNMEQVFVNTANVAQQEAVKIQDAWDKVVDAENYAREIGNENKGKWSVNKNSAEYLQLADAVRGATEAEREHDTVLQHNIKTDQDMADALDKVNAAEDSVSDSIDRANDSFDKQAYAVYDSARAAEEAARKFDQVKMRMLSLLSATSVFNLIKKEVKATYEDVKQLDKSFASIAMVTSNSVEGMWKSYSHYAQMASQLGQSTDSMIEASALFYQQGLKENEALELTANTMKLATLAGNDFSTATQEMTSAIRGFKMEMSEGAHVTDVYSTLAANAAATVDDIAQAMARTASIANSAGMSFENTSAFLTQMIETTQESAENIGTSLKTIIARFTELKKNVAGTADSEFDDLEYNKVDKALKSVGVSLKDVNGQFRNLDEVFLELSKKWSTLDRNTQRYVATIAAGSRQQSRFIAMMDNYERTAELMDKAANSTGKADQQFAKYADTMEYKLNQIKTKWEEFRVGILSSDTFKGFLDGISSLLNRLKNIKFNWYRIIPAGTLGIWAAKTFITNTITTIKTMSTGITTLVTNLSNKAIGVANRIFNKGLSKIHVELDFDKLKADIERAKMELETLKTSWGNGYGYQAAMGIDNTGNNKEYVQAYYDEIVRLTGSAQQAKQAVEGLNSALYVSRGRVYGNAQAMGDAATQIDNVKNRTAQLNTEIQKGEKQSKVLDARLAASKMAWQGVASAVTMAAAAVMTGAASFDEAGDMILKSMAMVGAQMAVQGFASGYATGGSFGKGIAAGLASSGVGLIIVGIGVAIAGAFKLVQAISDKIKASKRTLEDDIADSETKLKQLEDVAKEQQNEAKQAQESAKTAQELKDRYEELSQKVIKTTEEQEEYNNLVSQIKSDLPQIITYYDEVTGQLRVQDKLWQSIVDKANAMAKQASTKAYVANYMAAEEEYKHNQLLAKQMYNNYHGLNIDSYINSDYNAPKLPEYIQSIKNNYDDDIEYAQAVYENLKDNTDYNIDQLLKLQNISKKDYEEMAKLFDKIADRNEDLIDTVNKEVYNLVEAYNKFDKEYPKAYEEQKRAMLAVDIQTQQGVSASVADFMARMASNNGTDYSDQIYDAVAKMFIVYSKELHEDTYNLRNLYNKKDFASATMGGKTDNLVSWGALSNIELANGVTAQDVIKAITTPSGKTISSAEQWDEIRNDDEDWAEYMNQFEDTARALIEEKKALLITLSESDKQIIEGIYSDMDDMTSKQLEERRKIANTYLTDDKAKEEANKVIDEQIERLDQKAEEMAEKLGNGFSKGMFEGWSDNDFKNLENQLQELTNKYGENIAKGFESSSLKLKDTLNLTEEQFKTISQIDWGGIDLTNYKEESQKVIDVLSETMSSDQAKKVWEDFFNLAKEFDVASFAVGSEATLDAIEDSIGEKLDKYVASYSGISKTIKSQLEDGFIAFSQSKELEKALKEVGLKASDYLTYQNDGKIILDDKKLNEAFQDTAKLQEEIIKQARAETEEKIKQYEEQLDLITGIKGQSAESENVYRIEEGITKQKLAQLKILEAMNVVTVDNWDELEKGASTTVTITKDADQYINQLKDKIQKTQDILDNDLVPGTEYYNNAMLQVAAAQREMQSIYAEQIPKLKSVKDAQEDYTKALEKYNDQLEDVAEKQEALNEKIKEYNELLNGSDNRKSSLDVLYNYAEAISTFNDEMSRSKDILSNAKSKDESYQALQNYFNSAHNLLVEEKAKQKVIEAGLKNYANMIENGGTSYTNSQTGEVKTINFGQYAKYDQRTGKYMVDQRLLAEAKFADKYKDLIESNIETYNKYADELLKSQDSVRKTEKELQDERLNALKKYTSMEKEIADALKEQYQKEVDQLKDKYDSMKDADDDYLDALEDALNKQKELRERERKYEDLAQKEKKLSLMQRDTSGSNELETRKLEEEIQDDRESLLEDAINEVVDGLKELYKSNQELNESDIELKQALLDNTAFWNSKAQGIAASFTSAEEYMEYMSNLSTEFADMTLAQQQEKLLEYGESYEQATEYMALVAMDSATETQDFILDVVDTTGEEIGNVIIETSETFTTEVTRMFDEVTAAFVEDMKKAQDAIDSANKALTDANQKLAEYQNELAEAGAALATAQAAEGNGNIDAGVEPTDEEKTKADGDKIYSALLKIGYQAETLYDINKNFTGNEKIRQFRKVAKSGKIKKSDPKLTEDEIKALKDHDFAYGTLGNQLFMVSSRASDVEDWVKNNAVSYKGGKVYETGGLVNYTGPAWVDGTPDQPEAFLNSEDTKAIGNAAKILSDIPSVRNYEEGTTITNNNGGDVSVEVNINVDHMDSDADIEYIVNRVKDEIVEVARPIGSSVILQQQV